MDEGESRAIGEGDLPALLALNNLHAEALSELSQPEFRRLVGEAFRARTLGAAEAFLLAFDERADYRSPNYLWFRERLPRFVYVDRVAVTAEARGRGHARRLYEELFEAARGAGHERVVCEVNRLPPNPDSDAFHARLGFSEMGAAAIHGGAKTVRYLIRSLWVDRRRGTLTTADGQGRSIGPEWADKAPDAALSGLRTGLTTPAGIVKYRPTKPM